MKKIIYRELEVAFSKHSQPIWFRIVKWVVIITGIITFHKNEYFSLILFLLFAGGISIHLVWRYKTKGWTQSWMGWNYEKNTPKHMNGTN